MGIKVTGLDEAIKAINELARSIEPQEIEHWMRTVESTANTICGNKGNKISLKLNQGNIFDNSTNQNSDDPVARDCLIRAIQFHLHSMPVFVRGMFEHIASSLRNHHPSQ